VIGAGPSGLVAAKLLSEHAYEVIVYDCGGEVGGTFANKTYEDGRLVSSKYLTPFSDLRMDDLPLEQNHPTVPTYLAYLRRYCDVFNLWPMIRFTHTVEHVRALGDDGLSPCTFERRALSDDGYSVRVRGADGGTFERRFDLVAVCSGLHNVPRVPSIPGVERFAGEIIHSSEYRRKSQVAAGSAPSSCFCFSFADATAAVPAPATDAALPPSPLAPSSNRPLPRDTPSPLAAPPPALPGSSRIGVS
jgi:dimethylaniline monooxygenase (N-oxide forming)